MSSESYVVETWTFHGNFFLFHSSFSSLFNILNLAVKKGDRTKVVVSVTLHVTLDCHSIFLARMSLSRCVGASIDILGER